MSNKIHRSKQADQSNVATAGSGPASPGSDSNDYQARHDDLDKMYKLRNGNGEVLQTPKRSSIARAKALLTTPPRAPPCRLIVTGSEWPVASLVMTMTCSASLSRNLRKKSVQQCRSLNLPALIQHHCLPLTCCRSQREVWKPI